MKNWQSLIPGCFAGDTAPFGIHPYDKERAIKMLHVALHQGIKFSDVINEAKEHLKSKNVHNDFIIDQIKLIRKFTPNPFKYNKKLNSAWVVTLEGTTINNKKSKNIIAIFSSRTSFSKIKSFMEKYYMSRNYSNFEKMLYANNRKKNPYPATTENIDSLRQTIITCGHNPFLKARAVRNLTVSNEDDKEIVSWEEISGNKTIYS